MHVKALTDMSLFLGYWTWWEKLKCSQARPYLNITVVLKSD
jgi:hypothetical protein